MARLSLALPIFDRCERPRTASVRAERLQPGRLAQGPDAKCGTVGRTGGLALVMVYPSGSAQLKSDLSDFSHSTKRRTRVNPSSLPKSDLSDFGHSTKRRTRVNPSSLPKSDLSDFGHSTKRR